MRELAAEAGVSPTTLRNWTRKAPRPLTGSQIGGRTLYTWDQLRAFCAHHPDLPKARMILKTRAPGQQAALPTASDPAHAAAALRNLRAAASSAVDAALAAVRLAEAAAASHREQVESLATTIRAYDDLITQVTGPVTAPR